MILFQYPTLCHHYRTKVGTLSPDNFPISYPMVSYPSEVGIIPEEDFKKAYPIEFFTHKGGHFHPGKNSQTLPYEAEHAPG